MDIPWPIGLETAFRDIARPTGARTVIACAIPKAAYGNTAPLLLPDGNSGSHAVEHHLLLANLNAIVFDFIAQQKVQGTNLTLYILEQLPSVPLEGFARRFGAKTAEQIIREDVLRLTYTAHDMKGFAADMGHTGPPFVWDEEDRLRRRARLDALFFHLYGLDRDEADYVLGTFPIVAREETERFRRFRSRALILAYMAALAAGNPDAQVVG